MANGGHALEVTAAGVVTWVDYLDHMGSGGINGAYRLVSCLSSSDVVSLQLPSAINNSGQYALAMNDIQLGPNAADTAYWSDANNLNI